MVAAYSGNANWYGELLSGGGRCACASRTRRGRNATNARRRVPGRCRTQARHARRRSRCPDRARHDGLQICNSGCVTNTWQSANGGTSRRVAALQYVGPGTYGKGRQCARHALRCNMQRLQMLRCFWRFVRRLCGVTARCVFAAHGARRRHGGTSIGDGMRLHWRRWRRRLVTARHAHGAYGRGRGGASRRRSRSRRSARRAGASMRTARVTGGVWRASCRGVVCRFGTASRRVGRLGVGVAYDGGGTVVGAVHAQATAGVGVAYGARRAGVFVCRARRRVSRLVGHGRARRVASRAGVFGVCHARRVRASRASRRFARLASRTRASTVVRQFPDPGVTAHVGYRPPVVMPGRLRPAEYAGTAPSPPRPTDCLRYAMVEWPCPIPMYAPTVTAGMRRHRLRLTRLRLSRLFTAAGVCL